MYIYLCLLKLHFSQSAFFCIFPRLWIFFFFFQRKGYSFTNFVHSYFWYLFLKIFFFLNQRSCVTVCMWFCKVCTSCYTIVRLVISLVQTCSWSFLQGRINIYCIVVCWGSKDEWSALSNVQDLVLTLFNVHVTLKKKDAYVIL